MFFIPGFLISIVTFPGVIVHELAHQVFCRIMDVPVFEVKYFQVKNPCGYVIHEPTSRPLANFIISIGPFLINTLLGCIILFPAAIEVVEFRSFHNPISLLSAWLGISILMHAFPSTGDAQVLVASILKNKQVNLVAKILTAPVIGLIYLGAIGSIFWLDLGYALLVGMLLPRLIVPLL